MLAKARGTEFLLISTAPSLPLLTVTNLTEFAVFKQELASSIIRHGLTEKEAFEVEAALIDYIDIRELTNVVLGHDSDSRGLMSITDIITKYLRRNWRLSSPQFWLQLIVTLFSS